jgi:hypothetical protein
MVTKNGARPLDLSQLRADPALAPLLIHPEHRVLRQAATTGLVSLDGLLGGGFPRGRISEIVGSRSSGRMRLLLGSLAQATSRGALVALVDVADGLDPDSAAAAGVVLHRLLWIRLAGRLHLAWPAADILVRGGGFDVIAVDVGDPPPWTLGRINSTAIVRLQRAVEGTPAVLLLAGPRSVAGSLAALVVALGRAVPRWASRGSGLLLGLETEARLVRVRDRAPGATARLVWGVEPATGPPERVPAISRTTRARRHG